VKFLRFWKTLIFGIAACLLLASCGSGGNEDDAEAPGDAEIQERVGYLLDSAVSGVTYFRSDGFTGVTGKNGKFRYYPGDIVEFKVGAVTLGVSKTPQEPSLVLDYFFYTTPLRLTPSATSADHRVVLNKLIFLQTLDSDGDLTNGIQISAMAAQAFKSASIDFDVPTDTFTAGNFAAKVTSLNAAGAFTGNAPRSIQSKIAALRHFDSLNPGGIDPYTKHYNAWWQEHNGCTDFGESALYLKASQVRFCPNLNGYDGCYDGIVLGDGRVLLPEMKSNQFCADNADAGLTDCIGYQQTILHANLSVQGDVIEGNFEASCKDSQAHQVQTPEADFLLRRTANDTNSFKGSGVPQFKQQLFQDIKDLTQNTSCNTNADCGLWHLDSWHICFTRRLAYSSIDPDLDLDLLEFKSYVYEDIEHDGLFDFPGGTIWCVEDLTVPACIENTCSLVDYPLPAQF